MDTVIYKQVRVLLKEQRYLKYLAATMAFGDKIMRKMSVFHKFMLAKSSRYFVLMYFVSHSSAFIPRSKGRKHFGKNVKTVANTLITFALFLTL